jgi:hypothetical protein
MELLSVDDDAEGDAVVISNAATVSVDATADEENSCDHAPTVLAVAPALAVTTAVLLASQVSAEPSKNGTGCDCRTLCDAIPRRRADGAIM